MEVVFLAYLGHLFTPTWCFYASFEHVNTPYSANDTRTALHIAAALGNIILVQLLLWVSYPKTIHLFLMSSIISALHVCVVVVVCSTVQMPD